MRLRHATVLGVSCSLMIPLIALQVRIAAAEENSGEVPRTIVNTSQLLHHPPFSPARERTYPLFLNAAPQDEHTFLTWNRYPVGENNSYDLYWRAVGDQEWSKLTVHNREYQAITGLSNELPYEFYLALHGSGTIRSHIVKQTPRKRSNCAFSIFFCTQQDADLWLQQNGINPSSLKCRGKPVEHWDINTPHCYYTDANINRLFVLNRYIDSIFSPPPNRPLHQVRSMTMRTIWPSTNPFSHPENFPMQIQAIQPANIGNVTGFSEAYSYKIQYHPELSSRITWFFPSQPPIGYAIYHEGHGGSGVEIASETINWLLARGVSVVNIDMPLIGANAEDITDNLKKHRDFIRFELDDQSFVALFLLPVKYVVDGISASRKALKNPGKIMMIGRSSGGWTTALYGTIDPRIQIAVPVAGLIPLSMRIASGDLRDVGDNEQTAPDIYDVVPYEDLMKATGTRASLYIYNAHDPCCFAIDANSPLVHYLNTAAIELNKTISVWVDEENEAHSISTRGYEVLDQFLKTVQFW